MNLNEQRAFYPTGADLAAMGQTLARDVVLWTARLTREYCNTYTAPVYTRSEPEPARGAEPPKRNHNKKKGSAPRTFASRYLGVTRHRDRWCGMWQTPTGFRNGPVRPRTEQGERWAAQDRARALGHDYLELRDGTREPYRLWESEEV